MIEQNVHSNPLRGSRLASMIALFFFQAEDGIRDHCVTGVQTCALPIAGSEGAAQRLTDLNAPLAQAETQVGAVNARLAETEQKFTALDALATRVEALAEKTGGLAEGQEQAQARFASVLADSEQIRTVF